MNQVHTLPRPRSAWYWLLFVLTAIVLPTDRAYAAVTAQINATQLDVDGDGANDIIVLRLLTGDNTKLEVLDNGTPVATFNLVDFTTIEVDGGAGNDTITIDDTNGAFTNAKTTTLLGGDGDDIITGGLGGETINGGNNNDTLLGRGGVDQMLGGDGDDTMTGGPGNDPHLGGPGNDRMIWVPGDGNDPIDGEDGNDTLQFDGGNGIDTIVVTPNLPRVRLDRQPGNIVMDIGPTTENLEINGLGGNDAITLTPVLNGLILITVNGGEGDDTIAGGDGPDTLRGNNGNDIITGGAGFDVLEGGDGNDTLTGGPGGPGFEVHDGGPGDDLMIWRPGDGDDKNDGGPGNDTLQFDGGGGVDTMSATAAAPRVAFHREPGGIDMDIGTTERLLVNGLGGDDVLTLNANLAALIDIIVDAGAGADTTSTFASTKLTLNGNTEVDTLNFNAEGLPVTLLANAILVGGTERAAHQNVENVAVTNTPSAPPTVTITSPTADPTTTWASPVITLGGTAADDQGVASVTWVNDRGGSGTALGTTTWSAPGIPLQAGANVITVTAEDTSGNRATDTLTVTVTVFTYSLAEGATGSFFDTDILLANPTGTAAPVSITYLKGDGTTVDQTLTLPPTTRQTIKVDEIAGLEAAEVSAYVTSTNAVPIVVERTMRWDATGYGAHTEKAAGSPAPTWYFAEGSQGFFDTFVLLANAQTTASTATVQFLREGAAPVEKTYNLPPTSRTTVWAGSIPEIVNTSFGIVVNFSVPGVAERAMYFGQPLFNAGHESAGVTTPSTEWYLAEGATGSFFTTFVLLANPGATPANVTMTYLPDNGAPVTRTKTVNGNSRLTINIATEDPALASAAVATRVQSDVPLLAERAQYWPGAPANWYEAHNSFGATAVSTKWGLAEGRVGTAQAYQTFILLANANPTQAAAVRITFLRTNGTTVVKNFTVNPTSRFNVQVNSLVPELANEEFGALIEVTNGVGIFVERAMYSDANGAVFAAGTNALATPLP